MNISKFDLIYQSILKSLIKQGGHAVQNASKIKRENIKPTIQQLEALIFKPLNITDDLWTAQIGSTGKKSESGDIDIAINYEAIKDKLQLSDIKQVMKVISDKLTEENIDYVKTSAINIKFPIFGESQQGEFVQIDLFPSTALNFAKFNKFSPSPDESKYSGSYRSNFLRVLFKVVSIAAANENIENNIYTTPDGIKYPASTFKYLSATDNGLFQVVKTFEGKNGKFLKNPKKIDDKTKFITASPQEVLDIIFGKNKYTLEDCKSFETIWNNILMDPKFPYKDKIDEIVLNGYNMFKDRNEQIPEQILKYMGKYE